jgi:S-adenosylhomocysteine hydrolase
MGRGRLALLKAMKAVKAMKAMKKELIETKKAMKAMKDRVFKLEKGQFDTEVAVDALWKVADVVAQLRSRVERLELNGPEEISPSMTIGDP